MSEFNNNHRVWQQKSWSAFTIAIQNIRTLLERKNDLLQDNVSSRSIVALNPPKDSGLGQLFHSFQLTDFERLVITLAAAVEFDSELPKLCGKILDNPQLYHPTFRLAMIVFPNINLGEEAYSISPNSTLRKWGLIELETENDYRLDRPIKINERVLDLILGYPDIDEGLSAYIKPVSSTVNFSGIDTYNSLAQQIARTLSELNENSLIELSGTDSTVKTQILALACQLLNRPLYQTNLVVIPKQEEELNYLVNSWRREAKLGGCLLLIHCEEYNSQSPASASLTRLITMLDVPVFLSVTQRLDIVGNNGIAFEIPALTNPQQRYLWEQALGSSLSEQLEDHHIEPIIANFRLSPQDIQNATSMALSQANPGDNLAQSLWNACRVQSRTSLDNLAERLDVKADWDDLILPPEGKKLLREMVSSVRYKTLVYERWGFGGKSNRGFGTSALFAGVSGTGKTMAAEVIANELELDLYRVDLSSVVSKYIGETEKNLSRLFDAAETGGGILLFDEGETLFSKRSEVNDSKDKYANMEVSYLLQRLEAYPGLAIITTNIADSLDSAFIRRLRYIINFPFPKPHQRALIWQRTYPQGVLNIKDPHVFEKLALLEVSGGLIRSIAIKSAFIAAEADKKGVDMNDIYQAVESEYSKLGRTIAPVEIQGWDIDRSVLRGQRRSQIWEIDRPLKPFEVGEDESIFDQYGESGDEEASTDKKYVATSGKPSVPWTYGLLGDEQEQPVEEMDDETLMNWVITKLDDGEVLMANLLIDYAVERNPDDSTLQYWLAVAKIYQASPYESVESTFVISKSALGIFDSIEEKDDDDWWGVPEADASIDYWRGVALTQMGAANQEIIDSFEKYLDAYPDGVFADEAMDYLESAKSKKVD